jgi:hypothetical protein
MKIRPLLVPALLAGCAAAERSDAARGYRGIEEVRILAKGME